jgi:hypothetical protein
MTDHTGCSNCAVCGVNTSDGSVETYGLVRWIPETRSTEVVAEYCAKHGNARREGEWAPGRYWRVTYVDTDGKPYVWAETSDEDEARQQLSALVTRYPGRRVMFSQLWTREESEWRPA